MTIEEIVLIAKTLVELLEKLVRLVIDTLSYLKNRKSKKITASV